MKGPYELVIKIILVLLNTDLNRDKFVTIHQMNIQSLAIEQFKVKQNLYN